MSPIISRVAGQKFTKFLHDVEASSLLLRRASRCGYSNLLWNASANTEGDINKRSLFPNN